MVSASGLIIAQEKQPDNSLVLMVTVPLARIKSEYQKTLKNFAAKTEIPGFRKGKAPQEKVEKTVGKEKIYQEMIKTFLPRLYQEVIAQEKIHPIVNPKVTLVTAKEDKDWQIKFVTCEVPPVKLGNYKEKIKDALGKGKIWTPENKEEKESSSPEAEKQKNLTTIINILNKTVKAIIPQILIEEELNQKLAQLIEKTEKMGLSLEQYLTSLGKTSKQIKEEYEKEIKTNWRLELALNKIADQEKITVSQDEIEKMIKKAPSEKERKQLESQRYVLASILRRQKTLEFLKNL